MSISENLKLIKSNLPEQITLVAVSKTKPIADVQEAYDAGQRVFGENKIQEMVDKYNEMPNDIKWHMIGHLQRNKVKYMAHFVNLIHGVDSIKTLKEINKQAKKHNRIINCLLQAKIAKEDSKFGLSFTAIKEILASDEFKVLENINVVGLMGMSTFTDNTKQIESEFSTLNSFFQILSNQYESLNILSIGMSGDYPLAIDCGSTMVRIGSAIFGSRQYL